ncbi:MAG: AcvB/VirJ family lysyl-phosphatidylglycerol hydrolase [Pseudomonadota bacterium]
MTVWWMQWCRWVPALVCALAVGWTAPDVNAQALPAPQRMSNGQFDDIQVYRPNGPVQQFVLLISGSEMLTASDRQLAQSMAAKGAMVAAVLLPPFYRKNIPLSKGCVYAAGTVENTARYIQAIEKVPTYIEPLLVGTGSAGSFVYALMAQAPADTFTGALSVGYCPRLMLDMPLCAANSLQWQATPGGIDLAPAPKLASPWTVLDTGSAPAACAASSKGFVERMPQANWVPRAAGETGDIPAGFDAAYTKLAARRAALDLAPTQLADIPVVEVPATGPGNATRFAVLISGDGGWASIDKRLAASLAKSGIPVVGLDSLRYFWTARTPDGVASDLNRVIRYYAARWKRPDVVLIGFSQGADVMPFAVNRLPAATRASVRLTALLAPGKKAAFEFHVSNWIGASGDKPIEPEAKKMSGATLCVYGVEERDSALCPDIAANPGVKVIATPGGHHLGGDYDAVAAQIIGAASP